jgi:hypothetical protein
MLVYRDGLAAVKAAKAAPAGTPADVISNAIDNAIETVVSKYKKLLEGGKVERKANGHRSDDQAACQASARPDALSIVRKPRVFRSC